MNNRGIQHTDYAIRSETKIDLKRLNNLLGGGCLIGIRCDWPAIGVDQTPIGNSTEFNFVVGTEDTTEQNIMRYC